jgi:phosphate-selective porin OprO/OprP
VTEFTNYFFQMDFGFFGRPTFTDVWLEQTKVPVFGNVRIGQWKQPCSLETVSSFRYTTFMERSVMFQPFTPFRHIGIGFYDYSDDLSTTWAASAFRTGQDQFGGTLSSDGGYGTAERLTWVPEWERNGENYLHLGVGHFFNAPPGDSINFRTIPEFFVGANGPGAVGTSGQAVPGGSNGTPFFVATGNLNVPYYNVLGSELLWVRGPVSIQSEVMVNLVNQSGGATAVLPGAYAQLGYFLTGEHRPYDRKTGTIERVIPKSNLTFAGTPCHPGLGAWELAARWSYLDLNDASVNGGTIMDYTAGLNWYWNPYTKMVFNYVHAVSDTPAFPVAHTDLFGVRAQIDF